LSPKYADTFVTVPADANVYRSPHFTPSQPGFDAVPTTVFPNVTDDPDAATTPVCAEFALAVPAVLVAVTTTRIVSPTSAATST
jgi:hypothetical protein